MPLYARPARLDDALQVLAGGGVTVLAGGTDFYASRVGRPLTEAILDITAVRALRGIEDRGEHWRLGATTTWTDLIEAPLPPLFDGLKLAAREVGGLQIQNSGTLAGNLCNASPAADGVPALLAMDAEVELVSAGGVRMLPLEQFILGPRKTALAPGELLAALLIPKPRHAARGHFLKLGARRYLVISIAMVGVVIEREDAIVRRAAVAVGSCSAVARRLPALEVALAGRRLDHELAACARAEHLACLKPIDDVRASADYRLDSALTLVKRALDDVALSGTQR